MIVVALWTASCAPRHPSRIAVRQCIDRADQHRRWCFQQCERTFEERFVGCYGAPSPCTAQCQSQQLACQAEPLRALELCGDASEDPRSCRSQLRADRDACSDRPDVARCDEDARRRAGACWQACQRTQSPALQRCARDFTTCLDACLAR